VGEDAALAMPPSKAKLANSETSSLSVRFIPASSAQRGSCQVLYRERDGSCGPPREGGRRDVPGRVCAR
jgi:hypothetical protein